jgi:hypothetical protein
MEISTHTLKRNSLMEKQTAVEWLENQMKTSKYFYKLMEDINSRSTVAQSNILKQAKEIEKQQIIDAYQQGYNNAYFNNPLSKEQYYQDTFKKD